MISESRASLKDRVARLFCYGKMSPFPKKWNLLVVLAMIGLNLKVIFLVVLIVGIVLMLFQFIESKSRQ
jgi:hypothetical protein